MHSSPIMRMPLWRYRLNSNFDIVAGGCDNSGGRPLRRGRSGRRGIQAGFAAR